AIAAVAGGFERLGALLGGAWTLPAVIAAAGVAAAAWFVARLPPADRGPTVTIFVFMLFNAVFLLAFEPARSTPNPFPALTAPPPAAPPAPPSRRRGPSP